MTQTRRYAWPLARVHGPRPGVRNVMPENATPENATRHVMPENATPENATPENATPDGTNSPSAAPLVWAPRMVHRLLRASRGPRARACC